MDFETISKLAYREGQMPKNISNLEQLIYYMLKDLYNRHYSGKISEEEGKKEKKKIEVFYEEQLRTEKFNKELMTDISNNIKTAEDDVCTIMKMAKEKETPEKILPIALKCIGKLVNDDTLKDILEV